MIFCDRNVHCELTLQRKDGKPTNEQTTDNKNETGNWKDTRSISIVSNVLKAEKDAKIDGDSNSDPEYAEGGFIKLRIRRLRMFRSGQDDFRSYPKDRQCDYEEPNI